VSLATASCFESPELPNASAGGIAAKRPLASTTGGQERAASREELRPGTYPQVLAGAQKAGLASAADVSALRRFCAPTRSAAPDVWEGTDAWAASYPPAPGRLVVTAVGAGEG
jgi:hypothetical protein